MNVDAKDRSVRNSFSGTDPKSSMSKVSRFIANATSASHLGGVPRRLVITTVGAFAKLCTSILNRTRVYNMDTLVDVVQSRPPGTPLVTVSNHMCTLDDPLMWGLTGLPITHPKLSRWTLTAEDICFTNPLFSYFFRLGKCLPITRGAGIFQPYMNDALDVINRGDWLHTFPEGKLSQDEGPMRRLKWGVASLIARADVQPIVLPIAHSGFEKVLPENFWFGKRPPVPLVMKHISIVVGEPMVFDIPQLKRTANARTADATFKESVNKDVSKSTGLVSSNNRYLEIGNTESICMQQHSKQRSLMQGLDEESSVILDEDALRWMYSHMSETIRCVLQDLVFKARSINKVHK